MRIGLVGYGTGGRHYHAPYIAAAQGIELAGGVARAPETVARIQDDLPEVPIYGSLSDMTAAGGIDAVTITTPPHTRRELVLQASRLACTSSRTSRLPRRRLAQGTGRGGKSCGRDTRRLP